MAATVSASRDRALPCLAWSCRDPRFRSCHAYPPFRPCDRCGRCTACLPRHGTDRRAGQWPGQHPGYGHRHRHPRVRPHRGRIAV
ncbi:hypothetical protein BRN33_21555, partial [Xanthomonas oryzae pv. oryzae]